MSRKRDTSLKSRMSSVIKSFGSSGKGFGVIELSVPL